jgi:hypothetical protein
VHGGRDEGSGGTAYPTLAKGCDGSDPIVLGFPNCVLFGT